MNFLELVKARYSSRKYAARQVEAEKLDYIMEKPYIRENAVAYARKYAFSQKTVQKP